MNKEKNFSNKSLKMNQIWQMDYFALQELNIRNLEKFRRAQNAVYDFFNNGLCNKRGLFVSIFSENENCYIDKWNIPTQSSFRYFTRDSWDMWEDQIERIFTPIMLAAAKEQGVK